MAADKASSSKSPWKYHVFLSLRGKDTRKGFTDHLYTALRQRSFITYRDDKELDRGEVIKEELFRAIEESLCAVVVLSQNYASSAWCLKELVKILECKKQLGRAVLPIFYDVDPSDVRNQRASFAEAFKLHEQDYSTHKEMVQSWRSALEEVGNLSGWHSKDKHEADLIKEVVESIWKIINPRFQCDYDGLVGIHSRIKALDSRINLRMGQDDVCFIGLWGMGGIGKTTHARALYETICSQFEITCFLANVKDASHGSDGLVCLQRKLLSRLQIEDMKINDEFEGRKMIKNLLCCRKVLLVLDDVDHEKQLTNLAGSKNWFGIGTRVIITTRDEHLLRSHGVDGIHKVEILNEDEARLLFCQKAFKRNQPKEDYLQLSKEAIQYAKGLPLALEVLGSLLCERTASEWKCILNKLNQSPLDDILQTLRISFDNLEDDEQKNIFLDIACFYNGMKENNLIDKLKLSGYNANFGIKVLMEKSLITQDGSILRMHDLLEEMGRNIVVQQSSGDVSLRSRLWSNQDIHHVLGENKGTGAIQAIILKSYEPISVYLEPDCFSKMHNLKLLDISSGQTLKPHRSFNCLPKSLKCLAWDCYPLKSLPLGVSLDELLVLSMRSSNIKYPCNGKQLPKMLKVVDLSYSRALLEFPDVSGVPNLEKLFLEYCDELVKVHPSLGQHKKLVKVNLEGCCKLKSFPRRLEMDSLEFLNLNCCCKLRKLPDFGENMKCLSVMLAMHCDSMVEVPSSVGNLTGLTHLALSHSNNLVCLPETIFHLNFKSLDISYCPKISRLPEILKENEALEELNCTSTAITELTPSISLLKNLKKLSLHGCAGPESKWWMQMLGLRRHRLVFPPTFSALSSLKALDLSFCNLCDGSVHDVLTFIPSSLCELNLRGNEFVNLPPGCFSNLVQLRILHLDVCVNLRSLPELPPCVEFVDASKCDSMEPLLDPQQLWDLFAPLDLQAMEKDRLLIVTQGREIPSWFDKQNNFIPNNDPITLSIVMDIPDLCCTSLWWGIAVCFRIEIGSDYVDCKRYIRWACANPKTKTMVYSSGILPYFRYVHGNLCILFLRCENYKLWQHQRGDCNQVQLTFHNPDFPFLFPVRKFGCRVICEEDFHVWHKTMLRPNTSSNRLSH